MATPRKSPFDKAYSRAMKLQVGLLFIPVPTSRELDRVSEAWQKTANLHGPCGGFGLCEWCDRWPPALG